VNNILVEKISRVESQVVLLENAYDPVILYIKSLDSERSQKQMAKTLFSFSRWYFGDRTSTPQDIAWSKVTYSVVFDYQQYLYRQKKLLAATVNNYINAVKGVLKKSARIKKIEPHNKISIEDFEEVQEIKSIRFHTEPKGRALSQDESLAAINICRDMSIKGIRDLAITMTFLFCGLRLNELSELEYPSCISSGDYLKVIGKGNKERKIPMNKKVKEALFDWIDNVRGTFTGPLYCRIWSTGEFNEVASLSHSGIRYILKSRRQMVGGQSYSAHDLRRSFGTRLLEKGVDIFVVQTLLGHASADTTRKYDKRGAEFQKSAVELL
jgi:site-specific recombinase XerD